MAFTKNILTFPSIIFQVPRYIAKHITKPLYMFQVLRNSFYVQYLAQYAKLNDVKHVHAHFADMATDLAVILNIIAKVPFTISIHARDFYVSPKLLPHKIQNAHAVFCCSLHLRDAVRTVIQSKNIMLVYHGLNMADIFSVAHFGNQVRDRFGVPPKKIKLLGVGRLVSKKGFDILVRACNILKMMNVPFDCRIIGDGREKHNLRNLIKDFDLCDRVKVCGEKCLKDVVLEYDNAHALVVPSVIVKDGDRDNIPNIIIEAQAVGLPVIASDLESIKEIIIDDETGFLCKSGCPASFATKIYTVFKNYQTQLPLVHQARKIVEKKFNVDKNVRDIIAKWTDE